jgi:nucleotide-binding universal stress UspA family protein
MRSLNEILLPTDFSPRSADVAHFAGSIARYFNSRITLLNVLPPINPAFAALGDAAVLDDVLARQKQATECHLNLFLAEELDGICVKRLVAEGDAAQVIADYAASEHTSLIMMPTRGYTAFRRFLLGSVTAKVLHDVICPVWTSSHITNGHPALAAVPKVIACAIDPTPEGQTVMQWASDLAADLQAGLIVVHAIPSLELHPETYYLEANIRKAQIGEARAKITAFLQRTRMPDAEVRVEGGSVSTVVRSVIEDSRADLLVIGRASGNGMLGRLRTHSYTLIRESPCPVISI